ncbi:hypothetical protein OGAPHI_002902 [Ogataea philodendri]|uniref:TEL2-interacting protein 1 n=1 Tax=Ogataea philodendri TaxID=1378263 RepID=A0A9P8P7M2_9ASCO|nr:uncharacterized protein OGAPHI_002902 [Ogataea philodendri]KAH3667253.1 hypothetical protein OGAPHI_002902 [Ogataea philodendri]
MDNGSFDPDDLGIILFKEVKQSCVDLSAITFAPETIFTSKQLVDALKKLDFVLKDSINRVIGTKEIGFPTSLADYIFVPIAQLLRRPVLQETELEYVLSIIRTLIKRCWSFSGALAQGLAQQFIPLITFLIGGKPNIKPSEFVTHTDETLINGIGCLHDTLLGIRNQGPEFTNRYLNDDKNMPSLGHMVTVLLHFAQHNQNITVQLSSLETLNVLFDMFHDGEILSFMLPGVVSSISKTIKHTRKAKVINLSLNVLTTIICYVFDDYDLQVDTNYKVLNLEDIKQQDTREGEFNVFIPENRERQIHRTTSWLKATIYQLHKAFKVILKEDQRAETSESYFNLCSSILSRCFVSCTFLVPQIINCLALICDQKTYFQKLTDSLALDSQAPKKLDLVFIEFEKALSSADVILLSPDSSKITSYFKKLSFFVRILSFFDKDILLLSERSIHTLQEILVSQGFQNRKKKISAEASYTDQLLSITTNSSFQDLEKARVLDGIYDAEVEESLQSYLFTLGEHNVSFLEPILLNLPPVTSNELAISNSMTLWLASSALHASTPQDSSFLIEDEESNSPSDVVLSLLEKTGELLTYSSVRDEQNLIQSKLVGLMCIEKACVVLGDGFGPELVDFLYPVVDNLASSSQIVRSQAQHVALKIAEQLYDGSVEKLITENCDYLADSLSINMTGDSITPRTPIVLGVLINIGDIGLVTQLDDIISTIFTLLDMYHGYTSLCEGFFLVFDQLVTKVYNSFFKDFDFQSLEQNLQEDNVLVPSHWNLSDIDDVVEFVEKEVDVPELDSDENNAPDEQLKKDKVLEVDSDDESGSEIESIAPFQEPQQSDKPPISPKLFKTLFQIFSYSERLSKHNSVKVTLITLNLINKLLPIMATDKSTLLKICASLWPTVSSFVYHKDLRVVDAALKILTTLLRYGNTFLSSRFCEIVDPMFGKFTPLIAKQEAIYKKRKLNSSNKLINKTSTSTDLDAKTFESLATFCQTALVKLGRLLPIQLALKVTEVSILYDDDETHYGYYDDYVYYIKNKV